MPFGNMVPGTAGKNELWSTCVIHLVMVGLYSPNPFIALRSSLQSLSGSNGAAGRTVPVSCNEEAIASRMSTEQCKQRQAMVQQVTWSTALYDKVFSTVSVFTDPKRVSGRDLQCQWCYK